MLAPDPLNNRPMDEFDYKTLSFMTNMNERLQVISNDLNYIKSYMHSNISSIGDQLQTLNNQVSTSRDNIIVHEEGKRNNFNTIRTSSLKTSSEIKGEALCITTKLLHLNETEILRNAVEQVKQSFTNNDEMELFVKESAEFILWLNIPEYCTTYANFLNTLIQDRVVGLSKVLEALKPFIKHPYYQVIKILIPIVYNDALSLATVKYKLRDGEYEDFIQELEESIMMNKIMLTSSNAIADQNLQATTCNYLATDNNHLQATTSEDLQDQVTEIENQQPVTSTIKEAESIKDLHYSEIEKMAKETVNKLMATKNPESTLGLVKPQLSLQYYEKFLTACIQEMFTNDNAIHKIFGEFVVKLIDSSVPGTNSHFINALNYALELLKNVRPEFLNDNWMNIAEILCPLLLTRVIIFPHIKKLYLDDHRIILSNVFKCLLKTEEINSIKELWDSSKIKLEYFMGKNQIYQFVVENDLQDICLKEGQLEYYKEMENKIPRKKPDKKKTKFNFQKN